MADIMSGTASDKFEPYAATTRGMITTVLYRLSGNPDVTALCPFDDVKPGSYYEKAISWAAEKNIVSGYGDSKFGPDDTITREQMAVILKNYAKYKGYDVNTEVSLDSFSDSLNISEYALTAMRWAYAEGLLAGSGGALLPQGSAERCQAAAIVHRVCENTLK